MDDLIDRARALLRALEQNDGALDAELFRQSEEMIEELTDHLEIIVKHSRSKETR